MSATASSPAEPSRLDETLTALFYLAMLVVLSGILTTAMGFQYLNGEIPCPLCLLQRVAMFGVCFGIIQNFRSGYSDRNAGWSILFSLLLLIISVRQTLLDIVPRPGHAYVGSAVFGLHMPVWSVLIATALLIAFGLKLVVLGGDARLAGVKPRGALGTLASAVMIYVLVLCAINFVSVIVQCGADACHTTEYRMLR